MPVFLLTILELESHLKYFVTITNWLVPEAHVWSTCTCTLKMRGIIFFTKGFWNSFSSKICS